MDLAASGHTVHMETHAQGLAKIYLATGVIYLVSWVSNGATGSFSAVLQVPALTRPFQSLSSSKQALTLTQPKSSLAWLCQEFRK